MKKTGGNKDRKGNRSKSFALAIVGMPGAGKTTAAKIIEKLGLGYIRLGQITIDILKEKGLEVSEANERRIREKLREEYGMAAYAIKNFSKIDKLLKKGSIVIDGLYSWEEYLSFKKRYKSFIVLAIYAKPEIRYKRLEGRKADKSDKSMNFRRLTKKEAKKRDYSEIENINKAGPIAMADYTIVNEGTLEELRLKIESLVNKITAQKNV